MSSKFKRFKRNTIISSGHIDSFCLICERHFDSEEAVNSHIDDEVHEERLLQHPYLDKYQGDHIRKVNKGYFCEFCSVILTGAARVNLHIAQKSHFTNKGNFLLKRVGSAIIAFDDILIYENAWHSFADETCAICSVEFENESAHRTESTHLLKFMLNKVEFTASNNIYRKIDNGFIHCITCNVVCILESLKEHFDDANHKKLYTQCQKEMKMYREQNKLTDTSTTKKKPNTKKPKDSEETNPKNKTKKKASEVDVNQNITETTLAVAIPKDTSSTKNKPDSKKPKDLEETKPKNEIKKEASEVDVNQNVTETTLAVAIPKDTSSTKNRPDSKKPKDLEETKPKNETKKEASEVDVNQNITETALAVAMPKLNKTRAVEDKIPKDTQSNDDAEAYAQVNNLTYNYGNGNAYCLLCDTKMHSNMRTMKEHVNGRSHKLKTANTANDITKLPMHKYVQDCVNLKLHNMWQDAVINVKICIPSLSYVMITKTAEGFRCQCCEVNMYGTADITRHWDGERHERAMKDTPVIASLDSEFVREVRPHIYHCGFCNLVIGNWSSVEAHLRSREHVAERYHCQLRLRLHQPALELHRRQQLSDTLAHYMMSRLRFGR